MKLRNVHLCTGWATIACLLLAIQGCSDDYNTVGVNSPRPGILQISLGSDDADNLLVFAGDSVRTQEGSADSLALSVGQGRAYRGQDFAILYKSLADYLEVTKTINPLRMRDGKYAEHLIFETTLPPAVYDSLKIGLTADFLQIGLYQIPLSPRPGEDEFVRFAQTLRIEEGRTTRVRLMIKPLASLQRVQDSYECSWIIELREIQYL
jgi:hypothetical protein